MSEGVEKMERFKTFRFVPSAMKSLNMDNLVQDAVIQMRDLLNSPHTSPAVKAKLILFVLENAMKKGEDEAEEGSPPASAEALQPEHCRLAPKA